MSRLAGNKLAAARRRVEAERNTAKAEKAEQRAMDRYAFLAQLQRNMRASEARAADLKRSAEAEPVDVPMCDWKKLKAEADAGHWAAVAACAFKENVLKFQRSALSTPQPLSSRDLPPSSAEFTCTIPSLAVSSILGPSGSKLNRVRDSCKPAKIHTKKDARSGELLVFISGYGASKACKAVQDLAWNEAKVRLRLQNTDSM